MQRNPGERRRDLAGPIELVVAGDAVTASASGIALVRCDYSNDLIAAERGSWGVAAAFGGVVVTFETVTLQP